MRKLYRTYTKGRLELNTCVYTLYNLWVTKRNLDNLMCNPANGFKGLSLFFKESIDLLNSYKFYITQTSLDVYQVSDRVILTKQGMKTGLFDLKRRLKT